jgi:hydroxyacylglutathione hydrolase
MREIFTSVDPSHGVQRLPPEEKEACPFFPSLSLLPNSGIVYRLSMDAIKQLPGWHLIGAFPDNEPDDVGSWILHNDGEAMLLEIPPGLTVDAVSEALRTLRVGLRYVTATHLHEDHLDISCWNELQEAFVGTHFMRPTETKVGVNILMNLGDEPLWLVKAPKHSPHDTVVVFRGTAMTGDIELGTLDSVNNEIPRETKAASMDFLRSFEEQTGYHVHTVVSAHLNDFRQGVNWQSLFQAS